MGKRILSVIFALLLCVGVLPVTAWAADVVANGTCGADGDNLELLTKCPLPHEYPQ